MGEDDLYIIQVLFKLNQMKFYFKSFEEQLFDVLKELFFDISSYIKKENSNVEITNLWKRSKRLFEIICEILDKLENEEIGFVWLDGILIQAMENGHWLLLEDVNFSNPTILDRLNSLLEPNGSILINESGNVTRLISCHPKFHLFFTLNPKFGLIS